tara:strand:+ start:202 stop:681 length:480 start_codon:yes stop_codon:yes gene_type:complete
VPLYEYKCKTCEGMLEELQTIEEGLVFADNNICECGGELQKCLGSFAKTPSRWGDETGRYGVNGMFSPGLGRYVTNRREEEKIMASMGKVPASDLPQHYIADKLEVERAAEDKITKNMVTYKEKLAKYGNDVQGKIKAITETLPAQEMLKEANKQEATT